MSKELAFILFGSGVCIFAFILTFIAVREIKATTKTRRKKGVISGSK